MEWLQYIIEALNAYAGLFSLLAVVVAIVVPVAINGKNRKDKKQEKQNELEAMNEMDHFALSAEERKFYVRRNKLEKDLKR